jgi:hypothetical protein
MLVSIIGEFEQMQQEADKLGDSGKATKQERTI